MDSRLNITPRRADPELAAIEQRIRQVTIQADMVIASCSMAATAALETCEPPENNPTVNEVELKIFGIVRALKNSITPYVKPLAERALKRKEGKPIWKIPPATAALAEATFDQVEAIRTEADEDLFISKALWIKGLLLCVMERYEEAEEVLMEAMYRNPADILACSQLFLVREILEVQNELRGVLQLNSEDVSEGQEEAEPPN